MRYPAHKTNKQINRQDRGENITSPTSVGEGNNSLKIQSESRLTKVVILQSYLRLTKILKFKSHERQAKVLKIHSEFPEPQLVLNQSDIGLNLVLKMKLGLR